MKYLGKSHKPTKHCLIVIKKEIMTLFISLDVASINKAKIIVLRMRKHYSRISLKTLIKDIIAMVKTY